MCNQKISGMINCKNRHMILVSQKPRQGILEQSSMPPDFFQNLVWLLSNDKFARRKLYYIAWLRWSTSRIRPWTYFWFHIITTKTFKHPASRGYSFSLRCKEVPNELGQAAGAIFLLNPFTRSMISIKTYFRRNLLEVNSNERSLIAFPMFNRGGCQQMTRQFSSQLMLIINNCS